MISQTGNGDCQEANDLSHVPGNWGRNAAATMEAEQSLGTHEDQWDQGPTRQVSVHGTKQLKKKPRHVRDSNLMGSLTSSVGSLLLRRESLAILL